ncbi:MAG TPA: glycoside hydrolase domain-containing protein [Candidatus Sulfotelmatobacter sp.]|nr:glycoside hydrolase domain-containing protein [Candidatus Sulfotelmatobacter sp.]
MRWWLAAALICSCSLLSAQNTFLGFDRNKYPGDASLKILKQTFSYAGYWLNTPPGESANTWAGHRAAIESAGFGFLVLFNGRLYAQLKTVANAQRLGKSDAAAAVASAKREGFPAKTIIFLDQEQGGRMLPEQKAYIDSWVDRVTVAGFRAGVYCSGQPAPDDGNVVTAVDIREHAGDTASGQNATLDITYWVTNDACPPAPGCAVSQHPPSPMQSGVSFAEVWQFAQSPQRKDVAGRCSNYNHDGNCYAPGGEVLGLNIDLNAATSPDPSHARTP